VPKTKRAKAKRPKRPAPDVFREWYRLVRGWPLVLVAAMLVLGLSVGRYSTPLDEWFRRFQDTPMEVLVLYTNWLLLAHVLAVAILVALFRRQWRLARLLVIAPLVGWVLVQVLKHLFERQVVNYLAYPSGHLTAAVIIWGMVVILADFQAWAVFIALTFSYLGMTGQAIANHYFTDTVGGVLLGTAIVWVCARSIRLDRCQPRELSVSHEGLALPHDSDAGSSPALRTVR